MKTKKPNYLQAVLLFTGILIAVTSVESVSAMDNSYYTDKKDSIGVYSMVEQMPQIVGGISVLYEHIDYPKEALDKKIEGRVFVQFVVDENGSVTQQKVLKDIGFGCGDAAVEALKQISFTPGIQNGVAVPVSYTLPVTFKLGN